MKYGHPTLVRYPVWVSLESDKEVKFLLKPLSYSKVYGMNEYYYLRDKLEGITNYTPYDSLLESILDVKGVVGFTSIEDILKALSQDDKNYLEYKLYTISSLTNKQLDSINKLIDIITEPQLMADTYNCEKCKEIPGMQQARNCPLIDIKEPAKFKLRISDTTYTACPMADIDNYVVNQIIQANNFISMNSLPLSGGIEEQSSWFVLVSQRYKARINALRANQT